MPETRVIVYSRGKVILLDRQTNFFNVGLDESARWVLSLDSDTCTQKRSKTKQMELDEYYLDRLTDITFIGKNKNTVQIRTVGIEKKREC